MNKSQIRKKILKIRKQNNHKNLSIDFQDIYNILRKAKKFGKLVGGYYPYNYEIDGIEFLEKLEKKNYKISLPKIRNNSKMDFFSWSSKNPLQLNKYGIPEPISYKVIYPAILLVPLVAFDKHNNRIGYGGGFYDRYIKKIRKNKKIITIGLAYSYQEVQKVPVDKNDMKLDFIITSKKIK